MALLQIRGKCFLAQHAQSRHVKWVMRMGHFLKAIILIPSSGQGELPAFIDATILEISLKDGVRPCEKGEEGVVVGEHPVRPGEGPAWMPL